MRNTCTRTLSLLGVMVFIGLSSSMAAEIPVVRGQLHRPSQEWVQGLFVTVEEDSTHTEISRVNEPATRGEGVKHLEKAAAEFASARQFLEQLRASR